MTTTQQMRRGAPSRSHQAGLTLIEVILGLSILSMVTIGLNQLADRWADDTKNTVAASQVRTFGEAVKSYIKDNYAAVQAVATSTTPAIIDVPTLIAAQKLPTGYQRSNAYAQTTCALVLQPAANRLQGMVITEGGKTVGDPSLAAVASTVGGSGGGVYSTDTANIKGAVGGWQLAAATYDNLANNLGKKCDGTAGNVRVTVGHPMMALWFENGDVSSAFLARDAVPGRPELNQMNTPLVMSSVQTKGVACSPTGAIARDNTGGILSCKSGTWQPAGQDTMCTFTGDDFNNLQVNGCFNGVGNANSPYPSEWVFVEVSRHPNPANYYVSQRATVMTGGAAGRVYQRNQQSGSQSGGWSAWNQFADPQVTVGSGNITATGNATATGNVNAANGRASLWNAPSEGAVLTLRDATGQQMHLEQINGKMRWINGPWNAELASIDQAGNFATAGRIDASGTINAANGRVKISAAAWAGWGCSQSSESITTDPNGQLLTCESGTWKSQRGGTNWYTAAWWSQNWTNWQYNGSGRSQLIQASSDVAPRDCSINGIVDGWGTVAQQMTAESQWSAGCFISFMVPPGKSWYVSGGRYGGTLNILTWVYTL